QNEAPARISKQPSVKASRHPSKPGGEGNHREDIVISVRYAAGLLRAVDTSSLADGISEDGAAELQEKNEPGLAEKEKGREKCECHTAHSGLVKVIFPYSCCSCRRIPRPGSARPAPPRVKHQESSELLTPERSGSAKTAPSMLREQQVSDEEDEQFVVETAGPLPEMPKKNPVFSTGGLVKRILETKKDYEASQKSSQTTNREKPIVSEASRKRERDLVVKEMEKFQGSIQTVCQHVLRLGRMVDYIQEDVDAMRNELLLWRQENREHAEALRREQSITDSTLEPLKAELAELEQLMKDQQEKICAAKANNLRNDEKIQRMILSISVSSRR
ncbi:MIPT3 protein, partial [Pheucticus melanocephalus]|nr:MIPT3 protein [Pheucticus melanocephalus]